MTIELHPSEAEGAYLNLTSPSAVAFVMWRLDDEVGAVPPARPLIVTLSYNQAGRFMDGGERVDNVPLAEPLRAWLAAFVAEHYRPEPSALAAWSAAMEKVYLPPKRETYFLKNDRGESMVYYVWKFDPRTPTAHLSDVELPSSAEWSGKKSDGE